MLCCVVFVTGESLLDNEDYEKRQRQANIRRRKLKQKQRDSTTLIGYKQKDTTTLGGDKQRGDNGVNDRAVIKQLTKKKKKTKDHGKQGDTAKMAAIKKDLATTVKLEKSVKRKQKHLKLLKQDLGLSDEISLSDSVQRTVKEACGSGTEIRECVTSSAGLTQTVKPGPEVIVYENPRKRKLRVRLV
jgi:hypothetical protein